MLWCIKSLILCYGVLNPFFYTVHVYSTPLSMRYILNPHYNLHYNPLYNPPLFVVVHGRAAVPSGGAATEHIGHTGMLYYYIIIILLSYYPIILLSHYILLTRPCLVSISMNLCIILLSYYLTILLS
jgi:hypothetical protein